MSIINRNKILEVIQHEKVLAVGQCAAGSIITAIVLALLVFSTHMLAVSACSLTGILIVSFITGILTFKVSEVRVNIGLINREPGEEL